MSLTPWTLQTSYLHVPSVAIRIPWMAVVNWWLNDYTGLQFQYGESDIEGGPLLLSNGASANRDNGANIKGFGTRMRYYW